MVVAVVMRNVVAVEVEVGGASERSLQRDDTAREERRALISVAFFHQLHRLFNRRCLRRKYIVDPNNSRRCPNAWCTGGKNLVSTQDCCAFRLYDAMLISC